MKTKIFNKRLGLKKETIVNLSDREMGAVHGGGYTGELKTCISDSDACDTLDFTCGGKSVCYCPIPPTFNCSSSTIISG